MVMASRASGSSVRPVTERVLRRLGDLAACSDEPGRITRLYLSPAHRKAADLVAGWMREAGMSPRMDDLANLVGYYPAATADAPVLYLGSHIDTVPNGGAFDGTLGVLSAIEIVTALHEAHRTLPFAIGVLAFGDEEGRFPSTLSGSRLLAGRFDPRILDEKDSDGISRRDALVAFGCDPARLPGEPPSPGEVLGYVEVHIEQGPVLEARGLPVGIVTAINGATRGVIEVKGVAGHAGTVPMSLRQDAFCAAAEMALAIERCAREGADLVATVGRLEIPGGVVNTVPGLSRFTIDVRSPSDEHRQAAIDALTREIQSIAARRRVEVSISLGYEAPAAPCDPRISALLRGAVAVQGVEPLELPSGAGHDAMSFRGIWPIAMLFVRCRGGVSHSPEEYASPGDIDVALRALAGFVERMVDR
jgi:allantoate deiminase